MRSLIFSGVLFLTLLSVFANGTEVLKFQPVPVPPSHPEAGGVSQISEAVDHIYVTNPYKTQFSNYVVTNADIGKIDADDIETFIQSKEFPNGEKFHDDAHYEYRDPRITAALINMKKAGFGGVRVMTDFANIFVLGTDDKTTSDFNRLIKEGKFKKNSDGTDAEAVVEFKKLLQAGFKVCGSDLKYEENKNKSEFRYVVTGPSVEKVEKGKEGVIFHLKRSVSYVVKEGKVVAFVKGKTAEINYSLPNNVKFDSEGNSSPRHRLNIGYDFADPKIMQWIKNHMDSLFSTFSNGGRIRDVKAVAPLDLLYKDGRIRGYNTDDYRGDHPEEKFNPNIIVEDLIKDAIYTWKMDHHIPIDPDFDRAPANPNQKVYIDEFRMMAYVFTDKQLLFALSKYFQLDPKPETKGLFLFEEQFADMDGPGFAALFGGYVLNREMGGLMKDFKGALSQNPNLASYVYQRWIEGSQEAYLNHGKEMLVQGRIDDKPFVMENDGSFNISGHTDNEEDRVIFESSPETQFSKQALERLPQIISGEESQGFVVKIRIGEFRNFLSHLIGEDLQNISLKDAEELYDLLTTAQKKNPKEIEKIYSEFMARLQNLYGQVSKSKVPKEEWAGRLQNIKGFLDWYVKDQGSKKTATVWGLSPQKVVAALDSVAYRNERGDEIRGDLEFALWEKGITPEELKKKVIEAAKAAGHKEPLPEPEPEKPGTEGTVNKKADETISVPVKCREKLDIKPKKISA